MVQKSTRGTVLLDQTKNLRAVPHNAQAGNMDPSVLNETSMKCEVEFSICYGDIFSESVPAVYCVVTALLH